MINLPLTLVTFSAGAGGMCYSFCIMLLGLSPWKTIWKDGKSSGKSRMFSGGYILFIKGIDWRLRFSDSQRIHLGNMTKQKPFQIDNSGFLTVGVVSVLIDL